MKIIKQDKKSWRNTANVKTSQQSLTFNLQKTLSLTYSGTQEQQSPMCLFAIHLKLIYNSKIWALLSTGHMQTKHQSFIFVWIHKIFQTVPITTYTLTSYSKQVYFRGKQKPLTDPVWFLLASTLVTAWIRYFSAIAQGKSNMDRRSILMTKRRDVVFFYSARGYCWLSEFEILSKHYSPLD